MCLLEFKECVANAEKRLGFDIDPNTSLKVYRYALRKLETIGKKADYLPTLFESELYDHFVRMAFSGGPVNV